MTGSERTQGGNGQQPCLSCETFVGGPEPEACVRFQGYLTPEEEEVLSMLRSLKEQARQVTAKLRGIGQAMEMGPYVRPDGALPAQEQGSWETLHEEFKSCTEQLERLRGLWKEWEARREEAHHRKMVLLGHEPWEDEGRSHEVQNENCKMQDAK